MSDIVTSHIPMTNFAVPTSLLNWIFDFDPTVPPGVFGSQYAFGIRTDDSSIWFHDGVQPTQWIRVGTGSGGGAVGVNLEDEGVAVPNNPHATINFVGAGVTVTDVAGIGTVTIPGGASGVVVKEEGVSLGSFTALNFVGAGATATDAGGGVAAVTVPGGVNLQDEGVAVTGNPHATINFVGAGVTATDVGGVGTVTIPGGITGFQTFRYTVTGAEPDLSQITITLPVAAANATYIVVPTCQGVTNIAAFDVPPAPSKTTTTFVLIATGNLTAGDIIAFVVFP